MNKGIHISSFRRMMYDVHEWPLDVVNLAQCKPCAPPHLARRKVRIVCELYAIRYWVDQGVIGDSELHLVCVTNPDGDSTIVPDHWLERVKMGDPMPLPPYKWSEPEPLVVTCGRTRFLYYPKSGEIWDSAGLAGNFDQLHTSKRDETAFAEMFKGSTVTTTQNRLDNTRYMISKTQDFSVRFFERRAELWAARQAKEDRARLKFIARETK